MEDILQDFGLTKQEIKVYLALMHLGKAMVNEISKKAGTYRTYTYEVLESLKKKGLISNITHSGSLYYTISSPEKLIEILKEKEKKVNSILPDLKKIYNQTSEKIQVEVYEGKKGMKTVEDDIIRDGKEIFVYTNANFWFGNLPNYFPGFIQRRIKAGIKANILDCVKSKSAQDVKKKDKKELRETRFLPNGLESPTITNIYGDKVSVISYEDDFVGIIIKNKKFAQTQKMIFDIVWDKCKTN